jgi:hypothetical protein
MTLKQEILDLEDYSFWRARFGRDYGPVTILTTHSNGLKNAKSLDKNRPVLLEERATQGDKVFCSQNQYLHSVVSHEDWVEAKMVRLIVSFAYACII